MSATPTRYIKVADTAKLVREALRKVFPGVVFSVKSKSYAGGASIRIGWENGPTDKMVRRVICKYEGASFDGMIDLKSYHDGELNGERVHFGADYIFTSRHLSRPALEQVLAEAKRKYGIESTITEYGAWQPVSNDHSDRVWVARLVDTAYCDESGRVVAYVEVKPQDTRTEQEKIDDTMNDYNYVGSKWHY